MVRCALNAAAPMYVSALSIALIAASYAGAPSGDVLSEIQGTWGWVEGQFTCETNPHTIRLSKDRRQLTFTYPRPIVEETGRRRSVYEVRGQAERSIRLFLTSETRKDEAGKLVEWDLIMLSRDAYVWRQSDWPADVSTPLLERCPQSGDA